MKEMAKSKKRRKNGVKDRGRKRRREGGEKRKKKNRQNVTQKIRNTLFPSDVAGTHIMRFLLSLL